MITFLHLPPGHRIDFQREAVSLGFIALGLARLVDFPDTSPKEVFLRRGDLFIIPPQQGIRLEAVHGTTWVEKALPKQRYCSDGTPGEGLAPGVLRIRDAPLSALLKALLSMAQPENSFLVETDGFSQALEYRIQMILESRYRERASRIRPVHLHLITNAVMKNMGKTPSVEHLARMVGYSPFHFIRAFKESTGLTPHQYVLRHKMNYALALLKRSSLSVSRVAQEVGFSNPSHFARCIKQYFGASPRVLLKIWRPKAQ